LLIGIVMFSSFTSSVAPNIPEGLNQTFVLLPAIHVVTGAIAQLLATYLVLRMWLEKVLPPALLVTNIKIYMRVTLTLWITTAVLGIAIYFTWYGTGLAQTAGDVPPPVATDDVLAPIATAELMVTEESMAPIATDEPASTEEPVTTPEASSD
jgi:hypothetical protein